MKVAEVLDQIKQRFPGEPEYYQAVEEVLRTIEDEYNKHPEFEEYNLIEHLCTHRTDDAAGSTCSDNDDRDNHSL